MKWTHLAALPAFALIASAEFTPNKGPECKLTCRNRVAREHCPSFHYVGGQYKSCAHSQYGCTDSDLKDCGDTATPPPLCVVNGPCGAGPSGCLEDKTGADDGLPAGEYVGHCPEPKSPLQLCQECRDGCAMRYPPGAQEFQFCLQARCGAYCRGGLLYRVQYDEAKARCTQKGLDLANNEFHTCIKDSLNGTIPETYRCGLQFNDAQTYCNGLNYTQGEYEFQGCISETFNGVCSDEFRCTPQFRDARQYCIGQGSVIGGPEFQKCISDQLADFCPKDIECQKRHTDAREFCKKEGSGHDFGSPDFQDCVARMLDPSCPKDFQCDKRKADTGQFCKNKKGLSDGTPEYQDCIKDTLGDICPASSNSFFSDGWEDSLDFEGGSVFDFDEDLQRPLVSPAPQRLWMEDL